MFTCSRIRMSRPNYSPKPFPFFFTRSLLKRALGEEKWKRLLLSCGVRCSHVVAYACQVQYISRSGFHYYSPEAFWKRLWVKTWKWQLLSWGVPCPHVVAYAYQVQNIHQNRFHFYSTEPFSKRPWVKTGNDY